MRRLLFATLGLCAALSAQGALLNKSQKQVLVPDDRAGFQFGVTGAYLRADYPQVDYVLQDSNQYNFTPDGRYVDNESDRDWGWGFMVGWRFGCHTGIDARLNYFTFCSDNDSAVSGPNLYRSTGIDDDNEFWHGIVMESPYNYLKSANAHDEFDLSAADLEFAQNIAVGCHTNLRLFVGVSHHDIQRDASIVYKGERPHRWEPTVDDDGQDDDTGSCDQLSETVSKRSEFDGWGPRVGMDVAYALNNGFGLIGHFSSAFFFGSVDVKTAVTRHVDYAHEDQMPAASAFDGEDDRHYNVNVRASSRNLVVPNIDMRLGVDYSYCFSSGTVLTAELGYWGRGYFGGVSNTHLDDHKHITQFDNVVYHGAYLTLRAQL